MIIDLHTMRVNSHSYIISDSYIAATVHI